MTSHRRTRRTDGLVRLAGDADAARRCPRRVEDTGLSEEFIVDLLLKTLYVQGARTGQQLVEAVRLPFAFVDEQLLSLQQRRLVEVRGTSGPSRGGYMFDLTGAGRDRAREALGVEPVRRPGAGAAARSTASGWSSRPSATCT